MPKRMTLGKLATIIKSEFDAVETKMATKKDIENLDSKIDRAKEDLSKQIASLRGELVLMVREEDKKINLLVAMLQKKKLLAAEDAKNC